MSWVVNYSCLAHTSSMSLMCLPEHRAFHGTERSLQQRRMHDCQMDPERKDVLFCDIWDISKNLVPVTKYGKVDGAAGDTEKNVIRNRIQGIMAHGPRPQLWLYKSLPTVQVVVLRMKTFQLMLGYVYGCAERRKSHLHAIDGRSAPERRAGAGCIH